jgi:hypothetical protein
LLRTDFSLAENRAPDFAKAANRSPEPGQAEKRRLKPGFTCWCLGVCLVMLGAVTEPGAALTGPAVLDTMLKQIGPAKTLVVRQRVESVIPAGLAGSEAEAAADLPPPAAMAAEAAEISPGAEATTTGGDVAVEALAPEGPAADAQPVPPPIRTEELIYQLPGGYRAEIRSDTIQRLYLEVGGEALLVVDGRLESQGSGWFERYKDLLLFTRRLALHRHLALKGVDLAVASLGLWEKRPVYVLGARFPDAAPAQIWVDKETLLPLRWLWQMPADGPANGAIDSSAGDPGAVRRFEIRYDRWQLFGKRRYPLRVQFFENHTLVRTLMADKIVVDAEVDAKLMDLETVRQTALPPEESQAPEEVVGDPAVDEIQEAIDIFKKRYE